MKTTYTQRPAIPLDFSNASRHAMGLSDRNFEHGETATRLMARSGVAFDGRSYWYRQYQYDLLQDALAYAQLDMSGPIEPAENEGHRHYWQQPDEPNAPTKGLMAELRIVFDGKHYRYDEYRYDRYIDAINYAQLIKSRSGK